MDEIKRLTPAQRARCNWLIRRLCANYDGGNCLPLDGGEGCVCVQMISYSLFGGRFCPPTRYSMPTFTGSAYGSATDAESPLFPAATGRSTARNAAAPSGASRRRTRPGGAASNIKRRESLDFQGFLDSKAGADQLFDLGISKILGGPRPAPDALSRFASQLCQLAAGQRRSPQAHSGVAGAQRFYHHGEHLRPLGLQV